MFYSHDLLSRRNSRFGAIWILANASANRRLGHISNREIAGIDIPRSCLDILQPPAPLSLRLTSTLLVGLAQAFKRKVGLLYVDAHSTRSRIVSTPSIVSDRGFNPLISCSATAASEKAITLPLTAFPVFVDCQSDSPWHSFSNRHRALGWFRDSISGSSGGNVDNGGGDSGDSADFGICLEESKHTYTTRSHGHMRTSEHTSMWETISIADSIIPRNVSNPGYEDYHHHHHHHPHDVVGDFDYANSRDRLELNLNYGDKPLENEHEIRFSDNGDLQFTLSSDPVDTLAPVGSFAALSGGLAEDNSSNCFRADLETTSYDDCGQHGARALDGNFCNPDLYQSDRSNTALIRSLEEAENAVIGAWRSDQQVNLLPAQCEASEPARKKQRLTNHLEDLANDGHNSLELTCNQDSHYLDMEGFGNQKLSRKCRLAENRRIQIITKQRVARANIMYSSIAALPALHLFVTFCRGTNNMPVRDIDQMDCLSEVSFMDSPTRAFAEVFESPSSVKNDIDPEQVRAGSSPLAEPDPGIDDLYLDIPWLNPKTIETNLDMGVQTRRSESASIVASREPSASIRDTPSSYAHTHGPPSSGDELEIQSFELAQCQPEMHADGQSDEIGHGRDLYDQHGLESFLSTSKRTGSPDEAGSGSGIDMDAESRSFKRFLLGRMAAHRSDIILFYDIMPPLYRTRRVAARAFVDLLQMATRSEFDVRQNHPYSTIFISQK